MSQSFMTAVHPGLPPLSLGVCSWSLQVKSIPELKGLLDQLGVNVVQIACGDPHHASWDEGDAMPAGRAGSGIVMTGAMLGFPRRGLHDAADDQGRPAGSATRRPRAERMERLRNGRSTAPWRWA